MKYLWHEIYNYLCFKQKQKMLKREWFKIIFYKKLQSWKCLIREHRIYDIKLVSKVYIEKIENLKILDLNDIISRY